MTLSQKNCKISIHEKKPIGIEPFLLKNHPRLKISRAALEKNLHFFFGPLVRKFFFKKFWPNRSFFPPKTPTWRPTLRGDHLFLVLRTHPTTPTSTKSKELISVDSVSELTYPTFEDCLLFLRFSSSSGWGRGDGDLAPSGLRRPTDLL